MTDDERTQQPPGEELVHPAIGHLIVLRSTLAACLTNVDAMLAMLAGAPPAEEAAPAPCEHPDDQLEVISGFGEPGRVRCRLCGEEFDKEATW